MSSKDLKYLLAYIGPVSALYGVYAGGWWSPGLIYIAFLLIPILELFFKGSKENHAASSEEKRSNHFIFYLLLYLHLPTIYFILFYFFNRLYTGNLESFEIFWMTLNVGILCGSFGINIGHEIGHRSTWHDQVIAKLLLLPSLYMHFNIEHNRGHHKHVATPEDPSSSRFNENIYAFWLRSVTNGYINAWQLESKRLAKLDHPAFHWKNEMIWFQLLQISFLALVFSFFGFKIMLTAIAVAGISFLSLETVNYIEHYGLTRKKTKSGRYEPVAPIHSWNSNHDIGRIFLYELTRHSDHHYKADRKYQILRHLDESPQLPYGYPTSMIMSLFPPLWFKIMNPLLPKTV